MCRRGLPWNLLVREAHDGHDWVPSNHTLVMHWVNWLVAWAHGLHARLKIVVGYALHPNHVQHLQAPAIVTQGVLPQHILQLRLLALWALPGRL